MKKVIYLVLLFISINTLKAQIPIGSKYDLNGMPFNGYYDPLIYSPQKRITNFDHSNSYQIGYYYTNDNTKNEGFIKFEKGYMFFIKPKKKVCFEKELLPSEVKSLVIGTDSFFVINNFYYKRKLKKDSVFVQYIAEINGKTFVKHFHFTPIFAQNAGHPPIIERYLVKGENDSVWKNFIYNRKPFKEMVLDYFGYIPCLKKKILTERFDIGDMLSIIKTAEFYNKYITKKPIYYNKYWQEISNIKNAYYSANITNQKDSIWTFEYYKGKEKLYTINYSSFYPFNKNGDFIAYFKNGNIRQIITYKNNIPKESKIFYENGKLKTQYQYIEDKYSYNLYDINYTTVNDSLGNNILTNEKSTLTIYDKFDKKYYTSVYYKNILTSFYRVSGKKTIFQIVNPYYNFKIKKLEKKFQSYISNKNYNKALRENAQGTILMYLLIDKEGFVSKSFILNSVHPQLDTLVINFIKSRLLIGGKYRFKLKPYKENKEKRYCELVIPIEFKINRFYRKPINYYILDNYMMQQQMMQQQIMNNTPPTFAP